MDIIHSERFLTPDMESIRHGAIISFNASARVRGGSYGADAAATFENHEARPIAVTPKPA